MTSVNTKGRYGKYIHAIITLCDFGVFNIAFVLTWLTIDRFTPWPLREILMAVNVAYIPVSAIFTHVHKKRALYMESIVRNAVLACLMHCVIFALLVQLLGIVYISPHYYIVYYPIAAVLLTLWWIISRKILKYYRSHGYNFTRVIIVGTGPTARYLYNEMRSDAGFGYRFEGFFSDDPEPHIPNGSYIGRLSEVADYIKEHRIDEVYYTIPGDNRKVMGEIIAAAENNVAQFFYVPVISRYVTRGFALHTLGSIPVLSLMNQPLENAFNRGLKRGFDILFSGALLLVSPLVYIPVAIAIKASSPGPVLFKQQRTGYRGRSFNCYKFRTMRVNPDADTKQAQRDDPRKTRVGDFLRKTSIDELPQFLNVFKGEMSVVGPRPHMLKHTEEYSRLVDRYMVRHYIKPGITGWAQVRGYRGQTDELWKMEKRVEHDVWYIKNWSFLLDMKIIYKTITNALRGEKNAY